jgi:hypothetical protein
LNLELGYNGQTELKLDEAGTLDLSGFIVQGGFRYIF